MNILPFEKQVEIIAALTEGCSIRLVERMTGVHRDTIMRLGVRIGQACERMHDRTMHSLRVNRIEVDEIWSYVGKKRAKMTPKDGAELGDQYLFTALASSTKALIGYKMGKRDLFTARAFLTDLRERVLGAPEISSDSLPAYERCITEIFGDRCTYGQIVKKYAGEPGKDAARRYSPGYVVDVDRRAVIGQPSHISTSYVERSNLTIRMANRRFTRLTNGFSKKLENHAAATSLFVHHYNFCRTHEAHGVTPAMALGIADHPWRIGELLQAALGQVDRPEIGARYGRFTVIDGGHQ